MFGLADLPIGVLLLALTLAFLDWLAVACRWRRVDHVLKPATLAAVLAGAWLLTGGPHDPWQARFFLPGLACSLAGDVFLMLPGERFFLAGLGAFLLTHLCYVVGLNPTPPPLTALPLLAAVAAASAALYRAIAAGLRRRGQERLRVPVALYSVVLGLMLFSAWATLFRPEWTPTRRMLIVVGASLFATSDGMLAWERFVARSHRLHVLVRVTYHLAQVALAASIGQVVG